MYFNPLYYLMLMGVHLVCQPLHGNGERETAPEWAQNSPFWSLRAFLGRLLTALG